MSHHTVDCNEQMNTIQTMQMLSFTPSLIYQRKYALPSLMAPAPVSLLPSLVSSHLDENGAQ